VGPWASAEGIGPVVVANSSGSDRRGAGVPLVRRLRGRSQADYVTASERLKIEVASLTAGSVGSGTAALWLHVCNVDRAAVDVVGVCGRELQVPPSTFPIIRRACAEHLPLECGIHRGYDYDKARHAKGRRARSRRHGILRATAHLIDPPLTPNLLGEVGV